MFKRMLFVAMAIGMAGACAPAPAPPPAPVAVDTSADEAKLKSDVQKWMDDFNAGNAEAVAGQYMEDAVLMPPNAPASVGRTAIRDAIAKEAAGVKAGGLTMKTTATTGVGVNGDMAWMSGSYAVVDANGANVDVGKYLSVHKKVNGTWLYVRDTWNSDMPPPPSPPAKK